MNGSITKTTRAEYDAIDSDNFSSIKHLAKSPFHYKNRQPLEETDALQLGRVAHIGAFEPETFEDRIAVWRKRRQGREWEDFHGMYSYEGREVITAAILDRALRIVKAVRESTQAFHYLVDGDAEMTAQWDNGITGRSRGRIDYLGPNCIVDLKTCADASPEGFGRAAWRNHYHVQAAYYVDGVKAATGREMPFVFIAVESSAPYVVQVYRVPPELIEMGRETYRDWLTTLHRCRTTGKWPGYAEHETDLLPPRWAVPSEEGIDDMGLTFSGETT